MPKRKRNGSEERIERYKRVLKKLEKEQTRKRRRIIVETTSDSEISSDVECEMYDETGNQDAMSYQDAISNQDAIGNQDAINSDPIVAESSSGSVPENVDNSAAPPDEPSAAEPDLDPELLSALGDETGNTPKYGENIHNTLAQRWDPILKKGLPKEVKEKLLKEHLVPENCKLLQAPKLNVEVAAAISETSRNRDKRKESDQQQLGIGISVVSKAITVLLTSENKIEAIKILSDGCRILTDLHYQDTQARISVINYALAKPFLNVVQESERDETLYGVKLSEKIKASKVIEKQGLQIKKYTKPQKATATEQSTNTRPPYPQGSSVTNLGNWSGPPRFQQNRGGRRGHRRTPVTHGRRLPPPQPSTSAAGLPRTRAPTRT